MVRVFQVGVGSGGLPVLDLLAQDRRIDHVILVDSDVYQAHNVERHWFPRSAVGRGKAELAQEWLAARRADLTVEIIPGDLLDPELQPRYEAALTTADIGVCAVDSEPAKYHFDALMRRHNKPWTLGEVLSGGIGGFVHWFRPGGPCYGCVASFLKRGIEPEIDARPPDYSQPSASVEEARIPASKSAVNVIAALHANLTQALLDDPAGFNPGFTTMLLSLRIVPGVFGEMFRPHRWSIPRSPECLLCRPPDREIAAEDLDGALHQALERLAHE
jgi:molybdopterin/thiamine biosynthesis adenylyltransferase